MTVNETMCFKSVQKESYLILMKYFGCQLGFIHVLFVFTSLCHWLPLLLVPLFYPDSLQNPAHLTLCMTLSP